MSTPKEPGVYFQVMREEYERLPRVNWSNLKLLDISPAHYRQALLTPWEDSDYKKLGRACHISVYEPEQFQARCVVWRGKVRRGVDWEKFVDEHPDDEILTEHQHETALAVGHAVRSSAMAKPYISGGQGEVTLLWRHGDVDCKSRLDFVAELGALVDLKTVNRQGGAAPEAFGFTCRNLKYVTQAAFYRKAYESVTGKRLPYYLVAAETMAPFAVQCYRIKESDLEEGERHFEELLDTYRACRASSRWPAFSDHVLDLELPARFEEASVDDLGFSFSSSTPAIGFGT